MQFGLKVNPYVPVATGNPWDSVLAVARAADESRLDSLWRYDHVLYEGGYPAHPVSERVMECFTTLGAIAAVTRRIRLGQLVLGVGYRNPAMAPTATSLDLISHGSLDPRSRPRLAYARVRGVRLGDLRGRPGPHAAFRRSHPADPETVVRQPGQLRRRVLPTRSGQGPDR